MSRARASTAVGIRLTTTLRTGSVLAASDAQDGAARWPEGEIGDNIRGEGHTDHGASCGGCKGEICQNGSLYVAAL